MKTEKGNADSNSRKPDQSDHNTYIWSKRFNHIFLWVITLAPLAGSIYFGILSLSQRESLKSFRDCLLLFSLLLGVRILVLLPLRLYIRSMQNKSRNFSPELARRELPEPAEISVTSTLSYMTGKPIRLVWDIIYGLSIAAFLLASLMTEGKDPLFTFEKILPSLLVLAALLAGGHFLWSGYYRVRSYQKKLIKTTGKYIEIEKEDVFLEMLEKSLKTELLFRSRAFVLTGHYILGYASTDTLFRPAAIPLDEIAQTEFYLLQVYRSKAAYDVGVLACRLKNGKTVEFYTSRNQKIDIILKVLDYYQFQYKKSGSRADAFL